MLKITITDLSNGKVLLDEEAPAIIGGIIRSEKDLDDGKRTEINGVHFVYGTASRDALISIAEQTIDHLRHDNHDKSCKKCAGSRKSDESKSVGDLSDLSKIFKNAAKLIDRSISDLEKKLS